MRQLVPASLAGILDLDQRVLKSSFARLHVVGSTATMADIRSVEEGDERCPFVLRRRLLVGWRHPPVFNNIDHALPQVDLRGRSPVDERGQIGIAVATRVAHEHDRVVQQCFPLRRLLQVELLQKAGEAVQMGTLDPPPDHGS